MCHELTSIGEDTAPGLLFYTGHRLFPKGSLYTLFSRPLPIPPKPEDELGSLSIKAIPLAAENTFLHGFDFWRISAQTPPTSVIEAKEVNAGVLTQCNML